MTLIQNPHPHAEVVAWTDERVAVHHAAAWDAWLHGTVAGLSPLEPGFRRFRVAPQPGGGLTRAERTLATPYGTAAVAWRIEDGRFEITVTVPSGSTAEIVLPSGRTVEARPGTHRLGEPVGEPVGAR